MSCDKHFYSVSLLPCPFCGGRAAFDEKPACTVGPEKVTVECTRCGVKTREFWNDSSINKTYLEAALLWNSRGQEE